MSEKADKRTITEVPHQGVEQGARKSASSGSPRPISVLIPCYNAALYLGEALESVLSQSLAPAEVILVDDGSTDGSREVAQGFGRRVRYHRQPHGGISRARNTALEIATGGWIAFLDADDVWTPDSLAMRAAVLDADPTVGLVSGQVEQFPSPEMSLEAKRRLIYTDAGVPGRLAGTMLIQREVFAQVGMFDPSLRIGETMDWVARTVAAGVRYGEVDHVVLRRRLHESNTTRSEGILKADYLRVLRAAIDRSRTAPSSRNAE